jgi:hypothetical protein
VAFVQDGEVYVVSTQDPAAVPRQVTFGAREAGKTNGVANYIAQEEMARGEGFWWSPDSTHIAFEGEACVVMDGTRGSSSVDGVQNATNHIFHTIGSCIKERTRLGAMPKKTTGGMVANMCPS